MRKKKALQVRDALARVKGALSEARRKKTVQNTEEKVRKGKLKCKI